MITLKTMRRQFEIWNAKEREKKRKNKMSIDVLKSAYLISLCFASDQTRGRSTSATIKYHHCRRYHRCRSSRLCYKIRIRDVVRELRFLCSWRDSTYNIPDFCIEQRKKYSRVFALSLTRIAVSISEWISNNWKDGT